MLNNFEQDFSASCPGGGDQIISGSEQSSAGFILLQNVTVCAAGQNELIYDIGTMDGLGNFVPLVLKVYSADMIVVVGPAAVFRLILHNSTMQYTYTKIFAVGVLLQDQGRNVIIFFINTYFDVSICLFYLMIFPGCGRFNHHHSVDNQRQF